MNIEAKNLFLRALTADDISTKYIDWLNDKEVNRYLEIRHLKHDNESCKKFVKSCAENPNCYLYGIYDRKNETHIGNAKLEIVHTLYKRAEISFFIGEKDYWGKGYAKEVVKILTNYGFEKLDLNKIVAGCYQENLASLSVFLKNGYSVEGFMNGQVLLNGKRHGIFYLGICNRT